MHYHISHVSLFFFFVVVVVFPPKLLQNLSHTGTLLSLKQGKLHIFPSCIFTLLLSKIFVWGSVRRYSSDGFFPTPYWEYGTKSSTQPGLYQRWRNGFLLQLSVSFAPGLSKFRWKPPCSNKCFLLIRFWALIKDQKDHLLTHVTSLKLRTDDATDLNWYSHIGLK